MSLDKKTKEKRVTVKVDPDLHRDAKIQATREGKTLSDKLRELLTAWTKQAK